MSKGYYETGGSDYLNDSPSVSKDGPLVPEHNHDTRYYNKEESDSIQDGNIERFEQFHNKIEKTDQEVSQIDIGLREANQRIESQEIALQGKASVDHIHDIATVNQAGFMSETDKQKLDSLTFPSQPSPSTKTHIHVVTSANQALLSNTSNKIIFDTVLSDTNNEFDVATNSITVKEDGAYLINSVVEIEGTATVNPRLFLQVFRNGVQDVTFGLSTVPFTTIGGVSGSTIMMLEAGDNIDIYVWTSQLVNTRGRGSIYEYVKFTRIW